MVYMGAVKNSSNTQHVLVCMQRTWVQSRIAAIHSMYWCVCSVHGCSQEQQQYIACIGMYVAYMGAVKNSSNTQHVLVCVQRTWVQSRIAAIHSMYWYVCSVHGCSQEQQQYIACIGVYVVYMGAVKNSSNTQHVLVCMQCTWVQSRIAAIHSMYWCVCSVHGCSQEQQQYIACIGVYVVYMGAVKKSSNTQHVLVCMQWTANNEQVRKNV